MKTNLTYRLFRIIVTGILFLTGCATGPQFSPVVSVTPEKALVYLYRSNSFVGGANAYRIWINDMHVTDMGNGEYYPYLADPGELSFKMKMKTNLLNFGAHLLLEKQKEVLKINVEAGKTYYVKHKWNSSSPISNQALMVLVDEETGSREIKKCRKVEVGG